MTNRASEGPRQLRPTEVKRLNREWRRASEARLALLLDSVAQPFNVGSIVRSAAATATLSDPTRPGWGMYAIASATASSAAEQP